MLNTYAHRRLVKAKYFCISLFYLLFITVLNKLPHFIYYTSTKKRIMSLMVITKKFGYSYIIKEKIAGDIFVYIYIYLCNMCIFSNGPLFLRELQSSERGII